MAAQRATRALSRRIIETLERVWGFKHIQCNQMTKQAQSEMEEELRCWESTCCECLPREAQCSEACENGGGQVECGKDKDKGYCGNQRIHRGEVIRVDIRATSNGAGCFAPEAVGLGP